MKGRTGFKGGAPPTDLLVCFPSRARLTLMPKPICSPSRPNRRHPALFRPTAAKPTNDHHRSKTELGSEIASEPTSPKVTCAGQIKVRHKNRSAHRRPDPKSSWIESLGLKKDVTSFLAVLRSSLRFKFNMQCFGSFHGAVDCCSDDDKDDEEEEEEEDGGGSQARNMLAEWFMLLDEENHEDITDNDREALKKEEAEEEVAEPPPKNALLLMRCRSAPAAKKVWLLEEEGAAMKRKEKDEDDNDEEKLMLMSYAPDFFKLSTEIAKETWVVGNVDPLLARSRSCKR